MTQDLDGVIGLEDEESESDRPWFLVHPDWQWVATWDAVTAITMIFIAVFTPFEIAYLPAPIVVSDGLFILGRAIDTIFIADMLLSFFLMVPKRNEPGIMETRWHKIVSHYLRGWFMLDLLAISASAFDIIPVINSASSIANGGSGGLSSNDPARILRVVRILRLVKLIRLLKASKRIKAWSVKVALPKSTLTLFSTFLECSFAMHWGACLLGLVTIVPDTLEKTWFVTTGHCAAVDTAVVSLPDDASLFEVNGTHAVACEDVGSLYLTSFW
jgi:hypothetical protein